MRDNFEVDDLKLRLDKFLAGKLPGFSRSQIQRIIELGNVRVNGQQVSESKFAVRLGDKVSGEFKDISPQELSPTNTPLKVLYNDQGLLIIDKPAGMVVHPGAGFKGETLASALLFHFKDIAVVGEDHRPGIVHRLDKDTSGVILVAKTPAMYDYLKNAFLERKIKKEYLALVVGKMEKSQGKIDLPIGKSKTDFRKQTAKNPDDPKEALTEYKVLEYVEAKSGAGLGVDGYSLLMVKLHTGRTHQIRVHLSHLGHPLVGDTLYGGKKTTLKNISRQFLHARRIEVRLMDGSWIEAESELPHELRQALKELGFKNTISL